MNAELSFLVDPHAEEASFLDVKLVHDWLQANRAQGGRYSDALYPPSAGRTAAAAAAPKGVNRGRG